MPVGSDQEKTPRVHGKSRGQVMTVTGTFDNVPVHRELLSVVNHAVCWRCCDKSWVKHFVTSRYRSLPGVSESEG